jgi:ribosomal protein S12 methylthiotransferase
LRFLREAKIERAAFLPFPERVLRSEMTDRCDKMKRRAAKACYGIQAEIMDDWGEGFVVRLSGILRARRRNRYPFGRSFADSPDIDGIVFFRRVRRREFADVVVMSLRGSVCRQINLGRVLT